ncbi:hypothetical protein CVT25_000201 [Psilocybe cyanescens]|uniref:Uncharacterized protein n=1 Tax=Psilocybe cyanescens TaxID=93625 RepID=A0A409XQK4_PSICY|nr:hypothetical protein CVT25_000201 [Psilocybe cyanescens]
MSAVSPLPPNFAFPKFDATLGALYVGSGVATILYGALSSAEQAAMMAGIYRFLVTDFLNPFALPSGGPGSAEVFIYVESLLLACISVMIQWFFCWRIWVFTASSFGTRSRIAFTVLTVSLSVFSFASYVDLAINGFNHKILTGNTPDFIIDSYSSSPRAANVQFLVLPHATVYGAIGFLLGKTYFNSFLAILNSREYLREKFDNSDDMVYPDFADPDCNHGETEETATGTYELSVGELRFASQKAETGTEA